MDTATQKTQPLPSNWHKPFFTVWGGQAVSLFGNQLGQFALVWYLTRSTGSATVLAMASLVAIAPQAVFGLFSGVLVDRFDRRRVMLASDSTVALASLALAALFAVGRADIPSIFIVLFVRAICGVFTWPAMLASTSLMVPERHLTRISGLNQTLNGAMNIAAPALGALLVSLATNQLILSVNFLTSVLAVLSLFVVAIPSPQQNGETRQAVLQDLMIGVRYILAWPGLALVLLGAPLLNFFAIPAFSLLPLLVAKYFGGSALELGLAEAIGGGGVVAGGLVLTMWGGFRKRVLTTLLGLMGLGIGALLVGIAPTSHFWLATVGFGLAGLMLSFSTGPILALMQSLIAPEMQGRVIALMAALGAALAPVGLAIAGPLSDTLGIQAWYRIAGVGCILMGIAGFLFRPVLALEDKNIRA